MVWVVCAVFCGGAMTGVLLMALLFVARERGPRPVEGEGEGVISFPFPSGSNCGAWHLTPRGWVLEPPIPGSIRQTIETPGDRVLTCSCQAVTNSVCGGFGKGMAEVWRCEEPALVRDLLEQFGEPPPVAQSKNTSAL